MIPRKAVEWTFRRLAILILPILIAPSYVLITSASDLPSYRSSATVWVVDGPGTSPLGTQNNFVTPAGRQAGVIQDLLRTSSFRVAVAGAAGLLSPGPASASSVVAVPDPSSPTVIAASNFVGQSTDARAQGQHVLEISATTFSPTASQAIVEGVLAEYGERIEVAAAIQAESAIAYFNEQLPIAEDELTRRVALLDIYTSEHPGLAESFSGDVELLSLRADVAAQDRTVRGLEQSLHQWHLTAAAAGQGQEARFGVQDPPFLPVDPLAESKVATYGFPVAALLLGVFISATFVYVAFRSDHTVRSSGDLEATGVRVLGHIPELNARLHQPWYRSISLRRDRDFTRQLAARLPLRTEEGPSDASA